MENNYTTTTTTTNPKSNFVSSEALGLQIFEAAQKCTEIYARTKGRRMSAEFLEDVLSDTYTRALMGLSSYDPSKSKVETWVSTIAARCQADAFKKEMKRRERFVPLESRNRDGEEYISSDVEAADRSYEADFHVESDEAVKAIEEAIDSLSENRKYILDKSMDGQKPRHIAKEIGCTPKVVAAHLFSGRKAVAKKLGNESHLSH